MGFRNKIIYFKTFIRYKTPYIFTAIAILLISSSIIGVFAASSAASTYAILKISKKIPVHTYLYMEIRSVKEFYVGELDKIINIIIYNLTRYIDSLKQDNRIETMNTTIIFSLTFEEDRVYLVDKKLNISSKIESLIILTSLSNTSTILPYREGLGIDKKFYPKTNTTPRNNEILINTSSWEISLGKISYVYRFIGRKQYTPFNIASVPRPYIALDPNSLYKVIDKFKQLSINIRFKADLFVEIGLNKEIIPINSIDAAKSIVNDVMRSMNNYVRDTYGEKYYINSTEFFKTFLFFTKTLVTRTWNTTIDGVVLKGTTAIDSPLITLLDTMSGMQLMQTTGLTIELTIPIFISTWYLLIITSTLVADRLRRGIALLLIRGADKNTLFSNMILSKIIVAIISGLFSLPLSYLLANYLLSIEYPEISVSMNVFINPVTLIMTVVLAFFLAFFTSRRVAKYFSEKEFSEESLYNLTQLYVKPPIEHWRPGMFITLMFILGVINYTLNFFNISSSDLITFASRHGAAAIVIVLIYLILNSILRLFYPAIITYFLVMYITHSPSILGVFTYIVSLLTGRRFRVLIRNFVLRSFTRVLRVAFIIALVIASSITYIGLYDSLENWIPRYQKYLEENMASNIGQRIGIVSIILATMRSNIISYRIMSYYGVFLAFSSTILLSIILVTEIKYELTVLRARGSSRSDLIRFIYGSLLTLLLIGIFSGLLSGYIWLRSSIVEVSGGTITNNAPQPTMIVSYNTISFIVVVLATLLILPMITILLETRKPVVKGLRIV